MNISQQRHVILRREAVRNVRIALSPHWAVFSSLQGEVATKGAWLGPAAPAPPPHDVMCPTPPRPR